VKNLDAFWGPRICAALLFVALGILVGQGWAAPNGWVPWGAAGMFLLLAAGNRWLFRVRWATPKALHLFGRSLLVAHAGVLRVVAAVLLFYLVAYLQNKAPLPMAVACFAATVYCLSLMRVRWAAAPQ
jgi:hypothetical protein